MSFATFICQEKFEKEFRVKSSEVPKNALDLIQKWNLNSSVKWFSEESNDGKSFEAKVKFERNNYSIEFSENGTILDIEKTVNFSELPKNTRENINKSLSKSFKKFTIKKVQLQFLGNENEIYIAVFQQNTIPKNANYEIELKGKKSADFFMYEVLLNTDFEIKKELRFSSISALNLQF